MMLMEYVVNGVDIVQIVGQWFNLLLFMILTDVVIGLLAGLKEGKLNSSINFDGLIKKVGMLLALVFLTFIDAYFQKDGVIVTAGVGGFMVYEGLSILENFGRIGVKVEFLSKYFDTDKIGGKKDE